MKEILNIGLKSVAWVIGLFIAWSGLGHLISSLGGSYAISLGLSTLIVGIFVILGVGFSSKWSIKDMFSNRFTIWKMLFMVWAVPTFIGGGFYLLMYLGVNYILSALIPMLFFIIAGICGYNYYNEKDKCPQQRK